MTYAEARALECGDKIRPKAGGPFATVVQITDNFVRLEWYKPGGTPDIINKLSPLWVGMELTP